MLAAGQSTRFGTTKQLATFNGMALVTRAVRNAEQTCGNRSVLVTGKDWLAVATAAGPLRGFLAVNAEFEEGLAGSIKAGVAAVMETADAVLLTLADQPLVTSDHLDSLVAAWKKAPNFIIASGYSGTIGPPVVFPRDFFPALMSLQGDCGAKPILDANRAGVQTIEFCGAGLDIDRPEDLDKL